jgi:uncharacterized membrane protein YkgB
MKELAVLGIAFVVLGLPFLYFYNEGNRNKEAEIGRELKQLPESVQVAGEVVGTAFRVIVGIVAFVIVVSIFWNGRTG